MCCYQRKPTLFVLGVIEEQTWIPVITKSTLVSHVQYVMDVQYSFTNSTRVVWKVLDKAAFEFLSLSFPSI